MSDGMRLRRLTAAEEASLWANKPDLAFIRAIEEPCPHTDDQGRETWVTSVYAHEAGHFHVRVPYNDDASAISPEVVVCAQCGAHPPRS